MSAKLLYFIHHFHGEQFLVTDLTESESVKFNPLLRVLPGSNTIRDLISRILNPLIHL